MKEKFLVATGICVFEVEADSPRDAIEALKLRIDDRRYRHQDKEIGVSLVRAMDRGELNFIVMNPERTRLLCGEFEGRFQPAVTRELADSLRACITEELYRSITL